VNLSFSFIIPVYNRPQEIQELLESFTKLITRVKYEIIIVEDGSIDTCEKIVTRYSQNLPIKYLYQSNKGPGEARNRAADKAQYDFLIFLDSDVLLPEDYLEKITNSLDKYSFDCFGGPDQDDHQFTIVQKAVDFTMTSYLTTGGIRGKKESTKNYEPRSFNLGIKRKLFNKLNGFSNIHPGEDPELIMRLKKNPRIKIGLIPSAKVIHKRRISIKKFRIQLYKFGLVRPIITQWHPEFDHITFYFPLVFTIGFCLSIISLLLGYNFLILMYSFYGIVLILECLIKKRNLWIALLSVYTTYMQFFSYAFGFLLSYIQVRIFNKKPEKVFPELFFSN